jgi:Methyltransferase FkbM domain
MTGICIEPNPIYWYRLAFRKCHALGTIVGANDFEEVQVVLGTEHKGPYSGIVGNEFDNKKSKATNGAVNRYTAGLKTLLKRFNAPAMIDYLSLDVEGAETFIMKGFPFDEYKFKVLTVERPKEELQSILKSNGYKQILALKRGDTLWAHESIHHSAVSNLAKNPDEIRTKVIKNWPPHVANKA